MTNNTGDTLHCVTGCKHFYGGEVRHHKDCPYYPESFSKMYDDLKSHPHPTGDRVAALWTAMIKAYEQSLEENDNQPICNAERLNLRCFFDFIFEKGYLK